MGFDSDEAPKAASEEKRIWSSPARHVSGWRRATARVVAPNMNEVRSPAIPAPQAAYRDAIDALSSLLTNAC